MNDADLIAACLAAWTKCPASADWPCQCDAILVADFQGARIFWPQLDGESFAIVRLSDSVELDDDALPAWLVEQLRWRDIRLGQPAQLQ